MFPTEYFPVQFFAGEYWPPLGILVGEVEFYGSATLELQQQYIAGGELSVNGSATYYADPTGVPEVDFQCNATLEVLPQVLRQGECTLVVTGSIEFIGKYEANGEINFQCGSDFEIDSGVQYVCDVEYIGVGFYTAIPISANPIVMRRNLSRYRTQLALRQEIENFKEIDP